jgi:5-methylcytosine-specific restriction endonuclease McrA
MPYANPADARARNARYYAEKRAEILAQQKQYKHACRAVCGDMTPAQWAAIVSLFNHCCAYCGRSRPLEVEHMIPLSRGGSHAAHNVVPACRECNARKGQKTPCEWRGAGMWAAACACGCRERAA